MNEQTDRLEKLTIKLREKGHRMTPQRIAILRVLIGSSEHPNAEQIYDQIKNDFPTTSLATVDKTVTMLKQMGEIVELDGGGGSTRYDCRELHPHPHLICTNCGRILDIDIDLDILNLDKLCQEMTQRTGYQVSKYRLDFFGICPQCM
ncbi:MAG: transcriptional repressor [Anaerolineaceae bacterium]|nr:transcriptional repressor [Anaerolineaceae bacterium]